MTLTKLVGIWGCGGFVGGTLYEVLAKYQLKDPYFALYGYDIDVTKSKNTLEETTAADIVFICVPTPMLETGECYTKIVENCIQEVRARNSHNLIVIKSTVPPGTTKKFNEKYGNICFNPEFLTEANAYEDFVKLPYQMIGIPDDDVDVQLLKQLFANLYRTYLAECNEIYTTNSTDVEMVKYTRNCFLATRLSFFNEIKQICDVVGANFISMKSLAGIDERVGQHYNTVEPENPGFGLSCLPKDLNALKSLAKQLGVKPTVLDAVWEKNLEVRKDRDWEKMAKAIKKDE